MPGFLDLEKLSGIQQVVNSASASQTPVDGKLTFRNLWRDSEPLRQILLQPAIAEPIARIVGSHTLRFWFDLTFVHFNGGIGTHWHHDVPMFSFKGDLMPSLWMALTPTHSGSSQLQFIAGSHKQNQGYFRSPEIAKPTDGTADGFVDLPDFDALIARGKVNMLTWDCAPGDAILLHPATIHGAPGNASNSPRIAMTTRWLGDDVRFLPHSYERALKNRAVSETQLMIGQKPHGDWFPLVYSNLQAPT